jgi:hypothetical protein
MKAKRSQRKQKKRKRSKIPVKAKTSTRDRIKAIKIKGGKFKFTKKGIQMIRRHPFIYKVVNEIISMDLAGLNLLDPKIKTKTIQDHEIVKIALDFQQKKNVNENERKAPFFEVTKKLEFGKYVVERVKTKHGKINVAMYRITSLSTGESVLIKIQPQHYVTSSIEDLETARSLDFRTPAYFLEFDFPQFNIQVLEAMKLPNMKQLKKMNPLIYARIKKEFNREARKLGKTFYDAGQENCLVLIKRHGKFKLKPYFYWIDLF